MPLSEVIQPTYEVVPPFEFNLRPGGGGGSFWPPCGFSRITQKRKGAAQPNLAYLFIDQFYICCEIFVSESHQVRSPGRVT